MCGTKKRVADGSGPIQRTFVFLVLHYFVVYSIHSSCSSLDLTMGGFDGSCGLLDFSFVCSLGTVVHVWPVIIVRCQYWPRVGNKANRQAQNGNANSGTRHHAVKHAGHGLGGCGIWSVGCEDRCHVIQRVCITMGGYGQRLVVQGWRAAGRGAQHCMLFPASA